VHGDEPGDHRHDLGVMLLTQRRVIGVDEAGIDERVHGVTPCGAGDGHVNPRHSRARCARTVTTAYVL